MRVEGVARQESGRKHHSLIVLWFAAWTKSHKPRGRQYVGKARLGNGKGMERGEVSEYTENR